MGQVNLRKKNVGLLYMGHSMTNPNNESTVVREILQIYPTCVLSDSPDRGGWKSRQAMPRHCFRCSPSRTDTKPMANV